MHHPGADRDGEWAIGQSAALRVAGFLWDILRRFPANLFVQCLPTGLWKIAPASNLPGRLPQLPWRERVYRWLAAAGNQVDEKHPPRAEQFARVAPPSRAIPCCPAWQECQIAQRPGICGKLDRRLYWKSSRAIQLSSSRWFPPP